MSAEENKALARRAWEVVFNQRHMDALYEFYAADALWHQPDQVLQGLEEVKQWLARPFGAFPDLNVSIDDVIAEGGQGGTPLHLSRHPPRRDKGGLVLPLGDS